FLRCCQQLHQTQGHQPADTNNPLATTGFTVPRNLIGARDITKLRTMISDGLNRTNPPFVPTSDDPGYALDWQEKDIPRATKILEKAFTGDVEAVIQGFFGCDFLIRTVTAGRLFPSEEQTVSYRWHRDAETPNQIHVILYLTDLSDTSGSTDLLPLQDTIAVASAGYDFPPIANRKSDLSEECAKTNRAYTPYRVEAKAGDALVFTPNRVLHRGVQPTEGARDALLIVVLPSPIPWRQALHMNSKNIYVTEHALNVETDPFFQYRPKGQCGHIPAWVRRFSMTPPNWDDEANL
ncbi:MAG TPA: hypothetical protein DC046_02515, partial [Rhodospirillaceae bacterium]|nr:hypothetical protein [Rhodospirillaceae bacterium]